LASRDIIVVGASTGGVPALQQFVGSLPRDFCASVFVTLHIPSWTKSMLPAILVRSGPLPASTPSQDEPIEPGHIYVAPPDHHLLLEPGRIHLWRGPKENNHRPAINPMFRSAAVAYGERVVGVVLTGSLDDGSAGLWWIKRYGGIAVVQDPLEAMAPSMPVSALQHVQVDYTVNISAMGSVLAKLVNGAHPARPAPPG
jgi:two-component system, chemotaxis family, protein-glutamate methylesterase/glutaminase